MPKLKDAQITTEGWAVGEGEIDLSKCEFTTHDIPKHDKLCILITDKSVEMIPSKAQRDKKTGFFPHPDETCVLFIDGVAYNIMYKLMKLGSSHIKDEAIEASSTEPDPGSLIFYHTHEKARGMRKRTRIHLKNQSIVFKKPFEVEVNFDACAIDSDVSDDKNTKEKFGKLTVRFSINASTCILLYGHHLNRGQTEKQKEEIYHSNLKNLPGKLNLENALTKRPYNFFGFTPAHSHVYFPGEAIRDRPQKEQFLSCYFRTTGIENQPTSFHFSSISLIRDMVTGFYSVGKENYESRVEVYCLTWEILNRQFWDNKTFFIRLDDESYGNDPIGYLDLISGYHGNSIGGNVGRYFHNLNIEGELNKSGLILKLKAQLFKENKPGEKCQKILTDDFYCKVIIINWEVLIINRFNVLHHYSDIMKGEPVPNKPSASIWSKILPFKK